VYISAVVVGILDPNLEATIWSKFAVGVLAVATIAAARVLIRHRNRPAEVADAEGGSKLKGVQGLYAAGL
jgi:hypothetical protein